MEGGTLRKPGRPKRSPSFCPRFSSDIRTTTVDSPPQTVRGYDHLTEMNILHEIKRLVSLGYRAFGVPIPIYSSDIVTARPQDYTPCA